jgi:hypothetical protein
MADSFAVGRQQGNDAGSSSEMWGGRGASMTMNAQGASLEFNCAHGTILQAIAPNAKGEFSVAGTYTPERGGPVQKNSSSNDLPATYKGAIDGDTMQLQIVLGNSSQPPPPVTLARGKTARLVKCR